MSDTMVFSGLGSTFGGEPDSYGDVIMPGAFKRSLKARGMPALLWQHDAGVPIGVYGSVHETDIGLAVAGELLDTVAGRDAYTLLKGKAITGLSIGFAIRRAKYDDRTGIRYLFELDLWEVSIVTFPANLNAVVTDVRARDASLAGVTGLLPLLRARGEIFSGEKGKSDLLALINQRADLFRDRSATRHQEEVRMIERSYMDPAELARRKHARELARPSGLTDAERRHFASVERLIESQRALLARINQLAPDAR